MRISYFTSHRSAIPLPKDKDWGSLRGTLNTTFGRMIKEGACWSPAYYKEGDTRSKANVIGVSLLVLDLDHLTHDEVVQVESNLAGLSYMAHPSFSSTDEDFCLRYVLELTRPVLAEEWPRFWKQAIEDLCVPADPATSDASRIYFLPARPEGAEYQLDVQEGDPLDVEVILARAPLEPAYTPSAISGGYAHGPIPQGQREVTLHAMASNMRRYGFEADEILAAVQLRNAKNCNPPLPNEEVEQTVRSAQRYEVVEDIQSFQEFEEFLDARKLTGPRQTKDYIVDLVDFFDRHDANSDDNDKWLIRGVLGKQVPQIMAGPPKAHKSWVMYDQALALASGTDWLGTFEVERTRALIISREDDESEAHRRLVRLAVSKGIDVRDLRGWLSVNAIDKFTFSHDDYVVALRRGIERWEPGVIWMDSLSQVHGCDENNAQEMGRVIDTWSGLCKEYGVSIVMVHHFNKTGDGAMLNRMRGSSALGAVVRHAIGVTKLDIDDPNFQGGVSCLEFEGNLPGMSDSFSIGVRDGVVGENKSVHMEYRGNAKEELYAQVKRDMMAFLLASEPEPQTKTNVLNCGKAPMTVKVVVFKSLLESGEIAEMGSKYRVGGL